MPKHEWRGTKLRFQAAADKWGQWVDLRGPRGAPGGGGGGGGGFAEPDAEARSPAVFMPMTAGDTPPSLLYTPDGELVFAQVTE